MNYHLIRFGKLNRRIFTIAYKGRYLIKQNHAWYALSEEKIYQALDTRYEGLDVPEAEKHLEEFRPNELERKKDQQVCQIHRSNPKPASLCSHCSGHHLYSC